jgi:hypothetical protein
LLVKHRTKIKVSRVFGSFQVYRTGSLCSYNTYGNLEYKPHIRIPFV